MTGTQEIAIHLDGLRSAEFRRFLLISVLGHVLLVTAFAFSPEPVGYVPRGVVPVELVTLPGPPPSASKPVVAPPKPVVAPPKPKAEKVVLPAEPTTPKLIPKPKDEPKEKIVAKVERPPQPAPTPAKNYEDVLAELRAESGEDAPQPRTSAAPAVAGPVGSLDGVAVSPQVRAWIKRVKIHVKRNWVVPPGFRSQFLVAAVEVELDPSGAIRGTPRITRPSGNPWYDEGVVRALQKSTPLPAPPEGGTWAFSFEPQDSY